MKVLGISGSPRKDGSTDAFVREVLAGSAEKGAQVEFLRLSEFEISGCKACMYCRANERCAQKDGMQELYEKIEAADKIVIGSPVYMGQMTSQTKTFMDRLFRYLGPEYSQRIHRETVLAFTQNNPDPKAFETYIDLSANAFTFLGFQVVSKIISQGGEIRKNQEAMTRARATGKALA